jgi:peptidoglycan L-alanyl-D-glutamate endopeptidase CwlK
MPTFSNKSRDRLNTCDPRLQEVFNWVVEDYDCTIIEGHRSPERQQELYDQGKSKVRFGNHNYSPSRAVDVAPWPIPDDWGDHNWKERAKFYHFAGYVKGIAESVGVRLRWGGDWDRDKDFDDQTFDDLVHFELEDD